MIHIDGNLVSLSDAAYSDIVMAYLRQIKFDYTNAVCRGNINKLIELEDHVLSGNFLGGIIGITSSGMIDNLRYSYDKDKYEVVRDMITRRPIKIIKKEKEKNGETKGRKA